MRHGNKINHLGRTYSHRKAMLSNMATSLIMHKRITTTVAKAKELRKYVEPLITKAKDNTTHSRRIVFSHLQNKYSVQELFEEVAGRVATRPGGYTRILKLGARKGDGAEMAMIELVDFNEFIDISEKPKKTRRSRRGSKKASDTETTTAAAPQQETKSPAAEASSSEDAAPESDEETKSE
ncbi:large subunit ribosomal protein L17 [Catalinimonas alkaloidigena]|uniref:Large ribosomal subunit protein bL17 n=1 Tax=Catalinimonas alkaloidigena TaxID=1075417 RepID=A0A1G9Q510_9BACT|nr:50S ribosomal protein L17 [Catalinimonas alkaloidigena]SDM06134.1 large subunit ribosomal protein L17 [Catalinimonas alkaloidigena]